MPADTMDLSRTASPQSPAPVALSELMAHMTPCSDTTHPSDKPNLTRGVSKPSVVEDPAQTPAQDEPRPSTTQQQPTETQSQPSTQEEELSPPPTDWLATRQQLLPRRNQGKKADWIRGWSAAVSSHGDSAYCACSEYIESTSRSSTSRGRVGKTSAQFADSVRTALQTVVRPSSSSTNPKKSAITITTTPSSPEPQVCRHCSRPPSPPHGGTDASSTTSDSLASDRGTKKFTKRVRELLIRVRRPASKRDDDVVAEAADMRKLTWPDEYHPRWATTAQGQKRFLSRPASQPLSAPAEKLRPGSRGVGGGGSKGRGVMSLFGGESRSKGRGKVNHHRNPHHGGGGASSTTSSSELDGIGIADSDEQHGRPGLSRSVTRLQRAAALLQRAKSRPKD